MNATTTATFDFREPAKPEPTVETLHPYATEPTYDEWVAGMRRMFLFMAIYLGIIGYIIYRVWPK